jgi:hypothetical protein
MTFKISMKNVALRVLFSVIIVTAAMFSACSKTNDTTNTTAPAPPSSTANTSAIPSADNVTVDPPKNTTVEPPSTNIRVDSPTVPSASGKEIAAPVVSKEPAPPTKVTAEPTTAELPEASIPPLVTFFHRVATAIESSEISVPPAKTTPQSTTSQPPKPSAPSSDSVIADLFARRVSDVQVQGSGTVTILLKDDNEGSRHQRFILKLASGQTLRVAHNIDIAPYLRGLSVGDTVEFYGEYFYNEKGGGIHWTHRDLKGNHTNGWLKWKGKTYQ